MSGYMAYLILSLIAAGEGYTANPVTRISASSFSPSVHYFRQQDEERFEMPVLVEGVLTAASLERICDELLMRAGTSAVDVQRNSEKGFSTSTCTLNEAFDLMMDSRRGDSLFAFCEGLLEERATNLCDELREGKERLFEGEDLFDHFPPEVKPSDCLVLAGEGAKSTLHRDPFEWTGTSLCLEGTKLWRFLSPLAGGVEGIDERLRAYRLDSVAWGDVPLSRGWQSDSSLWGEVGGPSAREFAEMEDSKKQSLLEGMAREGAPMDGAWSAVQKPGDLLVVPAFWWHQTLAVEPSLAVASQRCGMERDAPRVVAHVLDVTGRRSSPSLPPLLKKQEFDARDTPALVVDALFRFLSTPS